MAWIKEYTKNVDYITRHSKTEPNQTLMCTYSVVLHGHNQLKQPYKWNPENFWLNSYGKEVKWIYCKHSLTERYREIGFCDVQKFSFNQGLFTSEKLPAKVVFSWKLPREDCQCNEHLLSEVRFDLEFVQVKFDGIE